MNPSQKRPSSDATAACTTSKKPKILTTPSGIALPQKTWFDPWNSSSTGHQRAENNLAGSTSWRDSRNLKLGAQYAGGRGGGKRVADTVGAGSEDFGKDGRKVNGSWRDGAKGLRDKTQPSLKEYVDTQTIDEPSPERESIATMADAADEDDDLKRAIAASLKETSRAPTPDSAEDDNLDKAIAASMRENHTPTQSQAVLEAAAIPPSNQAEYHDSLPTEDNEHEDDGQPKQIFHNLVFYINGSTAQLISDHKLKYLISSHGGHLTISHARKQVTHVIIGTPQTSQRGAVIGAGGSLAGSKIQKEVIKHRGKGVKFVGAQWVIDSVNAGKRMVETKYENVKLGGAGQGSVFGMFKATKPGCSGPKKVADLTDEELGLA